MLFIPHADQPWIVLEFLPHGDLKTFLTVSLIVVCTSHYISLITIIQKKKQPVNKLVKYMLDVATGMHYISDKGLIHRV